MDDTHIQNTNDEIIVPEDPKKKKSKKELLSTVAIIVSAPIIAILLTVFVFQSYEVDGPSMKDTLEDKDRLIVMKLGKTWAEITRSNYIPKRNSIIVFDLKGASSDGSDRQIIKRVIGLPGDRVVIKEGKVTIYNKEKPEGFNPDDQVPDTALNSVTDTNVDQTVKEGEVFVLGDNRKNSLDSRFFGTVQSKNIIGELSLRIYPFNTIKKFD